MSTNIIKFLHLLCGTTILGLMVANFFYISYSFNQKNRLLIQYALKTSFFADGVIFICLMIQSWTATLLVLASEFSFRTPWILVAYHLFALVILFWLANILIKISFYRSEKKFAIKIFYFLNTSIILLFLMIIHDAVMQDTWFNFLFRNH